MAEFEDLEMMMSDALGEGAPKTAVIAARMDQAVQARRCGDFEAALDAFRHVLDEDPQHPAALLAAAEISRLTGRPRDALQYCLTLLESAPGRADARMEMAAVLRGMGRSEEAHAIHGLLLHEAPHAAASWCGMAQMLAEEGYDDAAEACLLRAVRLEPAHVPARLALARVQMAKAEWDRAEDSFQHVLILDSQNTDAHAGLARVLIRRSGLDEAAEHLDRALALDDEHVEARLARADLCAMAGDVDGACHDAQWRRHLPDQSRPILPGRPWDGRVLEGETLLLAAEEDLSDTIRMLRFVPQAIARAGRVLLMVPSELAELAASIPGLLGVLGDDADPDEVEAEVHASLMDLPLLLEVELGALPAPPYLTLPPERRRTLTVPPGTVLKVGLVWAEDKEAPQVLGLPALLSLAAIPGVALFSLQLGRHADDAARMADPTLLTDLAPTIADLSDLAARIIEMDMVIAAESAAAHLAGAMGVPLWLTLPEAAAAVWMKDRSDSPWYPSARLLRLPSLLLPVLRTEVEALTAEAQERDRNERHRWTGPQAAAGSFLTAHVTAGDLVIDVGPGDGGLTLDAAAHPSGEVRVLALEPSPLDADFLRDSLAIAGLEDAVEVATAAIGEDDTPVLVSRQPRCGRQVFPLPAWVPSRMRTSTLADLLEQRPKLNSRPIMLRLGQSGWEAEALRGLRHHLPRCRGVVFAHTAGSTAAALLEQAGFSLWRFASETARGALTAFAGETGEVLALGAGLAPQAFYGPAHLPVGPEVLAAARAEAQGLTTQALSAQARGGLDEAAACYGRALALDPLATGANANRGVLQRLNGNSQAAAALFRRALVRVPVPAVASNLGNVLRELAITDEAETAHLQAIAAEPDNPGFLLGLALLRRDQGRLREAAALLERVCQTRPDDSASAWMLAQVLMAAGDPGAAFPRFGHRRSSPSPAPAVPPWRGEDVMAQSILVYDDGDAADTILLSRFLPLLATRGALITLVCQPDLVPLLATLPGLEAVVELGSPLPPMDFTVSLFDLPHRLAATKIPPLAPLHLPGTIRPHRFARDPRLRVGLAWGGWAGSGGPAPLAALLRLAADSRLALVALADEAKAAAIPDLGAEALVIPLTPAPQDLSDMAAALAGLDVVVGGDCPEIHLAAALGIPTWVLLPQGFNWRWPQNRQDSPYYPTLRVFRQSENGAWRPAIERIADALAVLAARKEADHASTLGPISS
ncbi:conserved hypothetical protein [Candidatus Terasakiella magnetica]|nr:conserved hypothetical protein [Candidatus Terasakiella magnetica]